MSTQAWREDHKEEMLAYRRKWYRKNRKRYRDKISERKKKLRAWFADLKSKLKCSVCGFGHPAVIQFHHTDPSKKEINIGDSIQAGWSIKRIEKEIKKCKVVCSNCHFIFHYNEQHSELVT
jgi:predicted HNH restriction endonuclease